ncbi:MAG: hypothetical protein IJX91_01345 [Clostridia bacterium]|nr:hypothetical protein [Clostridia bacterium]
MWTKILKRAKNIFIRAKTLDYRHYICAGFTVVSVLLAIFRFPYALGRLGESFVDIWNSCKFYVAELFNLQIYGKITVLDYTKMPFEMPFDLPMTWEEFKVSWGNYWKVFITGDNILTYMTSYADFLEILSKVLLIAMPFLVFWLIYKAIKKPVTNNARNVESKALKRWKRFEDKVCAPVRDWIKNFISFIVYNSFWWKTWAFVWAYSFNFIAIVLEFIAFYIYFIASLQLTDLYTQLLKLLMDLSVVIDFFPGVIWTAIFFFFLHLIVRHVGYDGLYHNERKNRAFLDERGITFIIDGEMGTGKTQMDMDMSLSLEAEFRERALTILLEINMLYPNFPWSNYEDDLKKAMETHEIFTLLTCERWLKRRYKKFKSEPCRENFWNYDYERHPTSFYDNLKEESLWQALMDYAKAYLIYTIECSLILANYSIRTDGIRSDEGNFPLWDYDFFKRDKMLVETYSQRCHILDFDLLRLGKQMWKDNPNRNAIGYGIYVVTELDKELKNTQTLKEVKATDKECNQKNDLTHECIKMIRHVATVRNVNFVVFTGEMQRCESLGIDVRGLGEVIHIDEKQSQRLTLPFFAPYYFFSLLFDFFFGKFTRNYIQDKYSRGDSTLFRYILHNLVSLCYKYEKRTCNLYGYREMILTVERGRMEGEGFRKKYYIQDKKTYSARYTTDCMSSIFEGRAKENEIGLMDIETYKGLTATPKELDKQRSHTQEEYKKLREN